MAAARIPLFNGYSNSRRLRHLVRKIGALNTTMATFERTKFPTLTSLDNLKLASFSAGATSHDCSSRSKYVLGCGSNVVDHLYNVKTMPKVGDTGFFKSPFRTLEKRIIGGVTLNHLSWATLAGVPCGLLAIQGGDESGLFIRSGLDDLGVSTEFIKVDPLQKTGECHVFIQDNGERSVLMAKGASSLINAEAVETYFRAAIQEQAGLVSTEVSQLPLSGVQAVLQCARESGIPGVLDLDVTPSECVEEAELGSLQDLMECVKLCSILKPSKEAVIELLVKCDPTFSSSSTLEQTAIRCIELFGCQLIAITDGGGPSILATRNEVVSVAPPPVKDLVDTTGAGDAFLGGLIAGITLRGMPSKQEELRWLGSLANGFGATCVQFMGGVPGEGAREVLMANLKGLLEISETPAASSLDYKASMSADIQALSTAMEALDQQSVNSFLKIITSCTGQVLTSGIGKSGIIACRLASSLSSIGVASQYVHATEWVHGELGKVRPGRDVVIFFSHSGNTSEAVQSARHLVDNGTCVLLVTSKAGSKLSVLATEQLVYSFEAGSEPFEVLPTHSLIVQEAVCNAIMYECIRMKKVGMEVFKKHHPGGSIGEKLLTK